MNIPGGHPPAKFWRFLALGAVNWRSWFWLDFDWTPFCYSDEKPAWLEDFSEIEKVKLCLCPDRLKMVHVDGQFKVSPNSFRIWFNFTKKTLLEFNFTKRLDFDRENHGCVTLSLYEHPRRPSTCEILTIFGLKSSKLEVFDWIFLEFMNRQLSRRRIRLRLCSHCPKYRRGRVEIFSRACRYVELCLLDISTVKSKFFQ